MKETSPNNLEDKTERAIAKLARIARGDTVHGGARALVIAGRMKRAKFDADAVVSDIYSRSNLSLGEYGAYECPECGGAYLGTEAALNCCAASLYEDYCTDEAETNCV
jgi:hypothetical protein